MVFCTEHYMVIALIYVDFVTFKISKWDCINGRETMVEKEVVYNLWDGLWLVRTIEKMDENSIDADKYIEELYYKYRMYNQEVQNAIRLCRNENDNSNGLFS